MKILKLLSLLLFINSLLLIPQWLSLSNFKTTWIALEAFFIVGLFSALPLNIWSKTLSRISSTSLTVAFILIFADTITRESLARPLNLYLDTYLLYSVYELLVGTLGSFIAVLTVLCVLIGIVLTIWFLSNLLLPVKYENLSLPNQVLGIVLIIFSCIGFTNKIIPELKSKTSWPAIQLVIDQAKRYKSTIEEQERFEIEIASSPLGYAKLPGLLQQLEGRDVLIAFIESYGEVALYDQRYTPIILPRLRDLEKRMLNSDLHIATGRFIAPTQGGQSWFSHGSLFSGLWIDNQLRYDLLLSSGRETLIDDFRSAGYRTVALLPANTRPWPEGKRLGYDEILARRDIDYRGPALNWVTMPDQFTWSFLENNIRNPLDRLDNRPLFVELSLISSHAPWTPILPMLNDWDSIGNGTVFLPWENAGERPEVLWRDLHRIREHFALSLEYAINAMTGYAERYIDDKTLLIVLGDHQPAPLITGEDASKSVPMHVISGEIKLLQPFLDWGFTNGAFPDPDQPTLKMNTFRDWFIRAFSESSFNLENK